MVGSTPECRATYTESGCASPAGAIVRRCACRHGFLMASELQRRKTAVVFGAMDVDTDGFLTESDFSALAARWTSNRGLAPDSASTARLTAIMTGWWETLRAASDADSDGRVSIDEVLRVVDRLPADLEPVAATATAMFEAIDA